MLNGEFGYGDGYTGRSLPFFKNFFAGGNNSVRGYDLNSLGPRDDRRLSLGGSKRIVGNIEVLFPVPFMKEDRSLRLSAFLDGGTVFARDIDFNLMRYSAGIALTWISPMGPLKVSIAKPLNDRPEDRLQAFQFMFGQQF